MGGGSGGKKRNPAKVIVAGAISGGIEACVSYPTEYVKTHLQLFPGPSSSSSSSSSSSPGGSGGHHASGPIQCAKETIRKDGVLGLYRGLSSLLYFSVPKVMTRFASYEWLKGNLQRPDGSLSTLNTLLCGLGAGVAEAVVAVTPMDTIKTRLIHDQLTRSAGERRYKGFAHGVKTIVAEQGIGGVYKGLAATVMKQGSNQAIRWLVFNRTKELMAGGTDTSKLTVLHTIAASVAAGAASVYGNTPVDVIKTRMQGLEASRYKGVVDCATQIAKQEGLRGFYKGATARLARVCLDVSVVMVLYEQISKLLDTVWKD